MKNSMKFVLAFLLVFSFCFLKAIADDDIMKNLKFERQILLPQEINDLRKMKVKYCNGSLFFIYHKNQAFQPGDTLYLFKIDDKNTIEKFAYSLPVNDWINDFYVNNDKFYLMTQYHVLIYNYFKNETKLLNNINIDNSQSYYQISVENNNIFLVSTCYSCSHPGNMFLEMDSTGNIIHKYSFETPAAFQLAYYSPSCRFDYKSNKFLVSDILEYNIKIYDENQKYITTLNRDVAEFKNNKELYKLFDNEPYNIWSKNGKFNDSLYSINRMELVQFYNDSTILVCYSDYKTDFGDFIYDIWKFSENKWYLYKKDLRFINTKK